MSLERACINCNRCYTLAKKYIHDGYDPQDNVTTDDYIMATRNEAMKALEDEQKVSLNVVSTQKGIPLDMTGWPIATKALRICLGCDYSSPKIAETIDKNTKNEKN